MRFNNDPGYYVAHYTRLDTALNYILENRKLRIGPLIETNDPKETKMWRFGVGSSYTSKYSPSPKELEELASHNIDFNRILRNGYKVLCVSQDAPNAMKIDFSDRAYCKPRMWAQYAGNHQGVSLIFDKQILHETIESKFGCENLYYGAVAYGNFYDVRTAGWDKHMDAFLLSAEDIVKEGLDIALSHHREKFHDVFFFQKNKDWEHEAEYRWIIRGQTNEPEFIPIEDSLCAILLGIDYPVKHLQPIHEYCKETNTFLSRIVWANGMPVVQWFDPKDLGSPEFKDVLNHYSLKLPS